MLPKQLRVDRKNINQIFKEGKFAVSPHLTFKYIRTGSKLPARISVTAPKSVAKLATTRNKLRRIGYKAVMSYINTLPNGVTGVFIFKQYEDDIPTLEHEIKDIFNKIN